MIRTNKELLDYVSKLHYSEVEGTIIKEKYSPKQKIIEEGKKVFSVYIIKSGITKCCLTEDTGKVFIQEFFGGGEIFGEIEIINNTLSFCYIEAISDLVVYKISGEIFHKLIEKDKKFNQLILKALALKINYTAIRHSYNQSHSVVSNLLRLKKQFSELTKVISKQDIANYLGITLRSLNRTFSHLKSS